MSVNVAKCLEMAGNGDDDDDVDDVDNNNDDEESNEMALWQF